MGKYYCVYTVLCTRSGNRILYSDEFGQTWKVLGRDLAEAAPYGDEAKIEELPDGNVLLSSRAMGGRHINIYTYEDKKTATGSWGKVVASDAKNMGVAAHKNSLQWRGSHGGCQEEWQEGESCCFRVFR